MCFRRPQVADKDPTSARADPKRKATVSTKKDPAKSAPLIEAGFRFGRRGHRLVKMLRTSRGTYGDRTSRVSELRLSAEVTHRIRANSPVKSTETGEMWVDTGADTVCVGRGFHIEESGRYATLRGYSDTIDSQERVPVVTATTALDQDDGTTTLLVFHEALYLGDKQHTSLLNLNQVRCAGHKADDVPKFLSQGSSLHGIETLDGEHIPFQLKGKSSLLYTRTPTEYEMNHTPIIELTSDRPAWDPSETDWEGEEEKFTRKHRKSRWVQGIIPDQEPEAEEEEPAYGVRGCSRQEQEVLDDFLCDIPQVRTAMYASRAAPVKTSKRYADVDYNRLRRNFGVTEELLAKTLEATTHMATRSNQLGLHRRFKTKFSRLRQKMIDAVLYSDTFSSNVTSTRGNNKTQGFVIGTAYYVSHFPMKNEKLAANGLAEFVDKFGRPSLIHTENANAETLKDWKKFTRAHWITCTTTEPYTPK